MNTVSLLTSDLNRDGQTDLIAVSETRGVSYFQNNGRDGQGNMQWLVRRTFATWNGHTVSAKLADINGDGTDDVIVLHKGNALSVFITPADPVLDVWPVIDLPLDNIQPTAFCVFDANRDGDMDILFMKSNPVSLFLADQIDPVQQDFLIRKIGDFTSMPDGEVNHMLADDFDYDGIIEVVYTESDASTTRVRRVDIEQSNYLGNVIAEGASGLAGSKKLLFSYTVQHYGNVITSEIIVLESVQFSFTDHDLLHMGSDAVSRILPEISFYRDNGDGQFDPLLDSFVWTFNQWESLIGSGSRILLPTHIQFAVAPAQEVTFFVVGTLGTDLSQGCYLNGLMAPPRMVQHANRTFEAINTYQNSSEFSLSISQSSLHSQLVNWPEMTVLELIPHSENITPCAF